MLQSVFCVGHGCDKLIWTGLFLLLDTAECSKVSFDELLDGVLRLRGPAQAIDLATLMYCNKRVLSARQRQFCLQPGRSAHNKFDSASHFIRGMISWLRERLSGLQDSVDMLHGLHGSSRVSRPRKVSVYASWKEVMTRVADD